MSSTAGNATARNANATATATGAPSGRDRRGMGWPIAMGAILALTMGGNFLVLRLANDDPSFAVERDYYQKAVHWDEELAQRQHNERLGWDAAARWERSVAGEPELRVRLTDASGAPLDGAVVRVEAFAISRASQVSALTLAAVADPAGGAYAAVLPDARPGRWEVRLEATRGEERFTAVKQVERFR